MTFSTYGEHAENAARALNSLISSDLIPADESAVDRLIHCREVVVDALRQRLYDVGQDNWYPPIDHVPARAAKQTLAGLDDQLATLVDNIAFSMPTLPWEQRRPPSDVLTHTSNDPTAEAWREAAIELLAASHALSAAAERPWLSDPGAGWWVMRDVSVALEAVVVLDARLDEVGLLNDHERVDFPMSMNEKRLVLSQTARVATWHATSAAPDGATPRLQQTTPSKVVQPVSLVGGPEDLVAAQHRLASFLRPLVAHDPAYAGEPEISADSARQVTASQLYLCRAFSEAATASPQTATFAAFFDGRAEVLEALQPQISHLKDLTGREPDMRRFWQQSELTTAVARMRDQGVPIRLEPAQMAELAKATHDVTHNLGKALRRELLRTNSNLRDANPRHEEGPVRVGRRSRLESTLSDITSMPAPALPISRFSNPLQRAALQRALDLTPTHSRPPAPFPAARAIGSETPLF